MKQHFVVHCLRTQQVCGQPHPNVYTSSRSPLPQGIPSSLLFSLSAFHVLVMIGKPVKGEHVGSQATQSPLTRCGILWLRAWSLLTTRMTREVWILINIGSWTDEMGDRDREKGIAVR